VKSPPATSGSPWLSFYIVYHTGSRDRLLVDLVHPLVKLLLLEGKIDSFFFVRYSLGGPHVRLRLRPSPGCEAEVRDIVRRRSETFLRDHPSPAAIPEEEIRRLIEARREQDPQEAADVLADNTFWEIPFQPETERYGGPELLPQSLDFFARTSARALQLLARRASTADGEWLAIALRLQVRQELGFAHGMEELEDLIAVSPPGAGERARRLAAHADQVFARNGDRFPLLVRKEIDRLAGDLSPLDDSEVARRLAHGLEGVENATRLRVFRSHIHMTANRLGLRNLDEACIARLLWHTLRQIQKMDAATWSCLADLLARRAERFPYPDQPLPDLLLAGL
jgi:thiopeptide-type bacteriocin biosynthesis protein